MWMWVVVLVIAVVVLAASGRGARMGRDPVVVAALLVAVVGAPQTASAAGSYGAIVEKGMRGCTTDPESGVVICFESPSVDSPSRGTFLQAWRAADVSFPPWDDVPAALFVRAVSVSAQGTPAGRPVFTYARADLIMPRLACREVFWFQSSDSAVRSVNHVSTCAQ
jgi:hypothetical protein